MEFENELPSSHDHDVYATIKEAIMQLNIWLTSIEDSIKECLTISNEKKRIKYKELHSKMKSHQDCLMRIVKICQNLSMRTELSEMNVINDYIIFAMERFEKIREHIESTLKMNELEMMENQCKDLRGKMNVYNELILSLHQEPNNNLNNKNQTFNISARLNKIKYLFNQYTEELEIVQKKLKNVKEKEFREYNMEMETLFSSIKMIEDSMEQQWRSAGELFMPYKMHYKPNITGSFENIENVTKIKRVLAFSQKNKEMKKEASKSINIAKKNDPDISYSSEAISVSAGKYSILEIIIPTYEKMKFEIFKNDRESYTMTVQPFKIYTHSCNIHYLLREISTYKLATFQTMESSHTSPYIHFAFPRTINMSTLKTLKIYHEPYKENLLDLQIDSLCLIPTSPYCTTAYKCAPHLDFICFLNVTINILSSPNKDTDETLFKHMIHFERSQKLRHFERDYKTIEEECLTNSQSLFETLKYDTMNKNYG